MRDYNKLIQMRVDRSFNIILGVTSFVAILCALLLYVSDVFIGYAILNLFTSLVFLVFFILANRIDTRYKILVIIVATGGLAVASFIGGGFTSAFLTLIILSNIVAVLLLEFRMSIIVSISSIVLMFSLFYYDLAILEDSRQDIILTWGLQIAALVLLIIVLHISAYSIKNYLIENIEGLEKAIKRSNQLAYYDQLTGLPNFNKFRLEVEEQIIEHQKDGFVLFFNLKTLRLINSTLGQEFGNQALVEVVSILNRFNEEHSVIAKISENEFVIWIDQISEEDLHKKFYDIMYELKQQSVVLKKKLEFYAAYASYYHEVDTFEDCYQKATLTLTYVKNNNILELTSYNDELEATLLRKESIKDLIEQAIIDEEFSLSYQAKYNTKMSKVVSVEGLARWRNQKLGYISPSEFIPIIESLNMSVAFGEFVIHCACRDYQKLQEKYNDDIGFSINISPSHLKDANIVQTIREALERYKIPPNKLTIEITEDIIIDGISEVKPIIRALRKLNVKISLDDFGTGYSSLNYITQLELDEIKIDKSFVDQIEQDDTICILIENIINMAKQFNITVIAEGVETKEQNDEMNRLGCYIIQGYYFAKPEALE